MLIIGYGTLTAPFQSRKRAQTIDGAAASKWPSDRCLSHACRDVAPSDLLGQNKKTKREDNRIQSVTNAFGPR